MQEREVHPLITTMWSGFWASGVIGSLSLNLTGGMQLLLMENDTETCCPLSCGQTWKNWN